MNNLERIVIRKREMTEEKRQELANGVEKIESERKFRACGKWDDDVKRRERGAKRGGGRGEHAKEGKDPYSRKQP